MAVSVGISLALILLVGTAWLVTDEYRRWLRAADEPPAGPTIAGGGPGAAWGPRGGVWLPVQRPHSDGVVTLDELLDARR